MASSVQGAENFTHCVDITVSQASQSAIEAIERNGGSLVAKYLSRLALRAHLKPWKFAVLPKESKPKPRVLKYYTDPEKRGFLSQQVQLAMLQKQLASGGSHSIMGGPHPVPGAKAHGSAQSWEEEAVQEKSQASAQQ